MSAEESAANAIQTPPISPGARAIGDILAALAERLPRPQPCDPGVGARDPERS